MEPERFTDCQSIIPARNLDELIAQLHEVFEQERVNVDYIKTLLDSYKSNPKDWKKFAMFDPHRYTRNLVDEGNGKFNLMALCWGEGHGSAIHDHTDAHCFVKVLDGQLMETCFEWPSESEEGEPMRETSCQTYSKDGVAYINDSMGLHRMENPSNSDRAVTLHLYCPPFSSCQTFDQRTGHKNKVKVTFWSEYGTRTPFSTNGCADPVPENN